MRLTTELRLSERHTRLRSDERGAVLIILAIFAVVLLICSGLAVDGGLLVATRRDRESLASVVATTALNAYRTSVADNQQDRADAAQSAAEAMASSNIALQLSSNFIKDASALASSHDLSVTATAGTDGIIAPGRWYFVPPIDPDTGTCAGPSPCPCLGGLWNGPCFSHATALNAVPDPNDSINAFQGELKLRAGSPFQAVFAKVTGDGNYYFESEATVATRPINVVFLIDLSTHVDEETHLPYELVGLDPSNANFLPRFFNPAQYSYQLTAASGACVTASPYLTSYRDTTNFQSTQMTCPVPSAGTCPATGGATGAVNSPMPCAFEGGFIDGLHTTLLNHCPVPLFRTTRPATVAGNPISNPLHVHAKYDYRCVTNTGTEDGAAFTQHHLVDLHREVTSTGEYRGPEPLNTMLHGLKHGLGKLKNRNIREDRVFVVGVDQSATNTLRNAGPYGIEDAGYTDLENDFQDSTSDAVLTNRHKNRMFFPRSDAHLSLPAGLVRAYNLLTTLDSFETSDNWVILITAGMSTCKREGGMGASAATGGTNDEHTCKNEEAFAQASIQQSVDFATDFFQPEGIKLHVMLMGDRAGPHTLLRKGKLSGTSSKCMDSDEARAYDESFVNLGAAESGNPADSDFTPQASFTGGALQFSTHFYEVNKLEDAARVTNGVWAPIRKPCNAAALNAATTAGQCQAGALLEQLDAKCGSAANDAAIRSDGTLTGSGLIDSRGRLRCDPLCRDRKAQVEAYIDEIFDTNPLLQVGENVQVQ